MSDIIYTPPASSGGTTINPQNNVIPVRLNDTTFIDSNIENDANNYLKTSVTPTSGDYFGLFIDFGNYIATLGDINYGHGTKLQVDDNNQIISTYNNGSQIGLGLNFTNKIYYLGDFNDVNNGTRISLYDKLISINASGLYNGTELELDDNNETIITRGGGGGDKGLKLDYASDSYQFGDYNGIGNATYFIIDVNHKIIATGDANIGLEGIKINLNTHAYSFGDFDNNNNGTSFIIDDASTKMTFNTQFLNFVGTSLTDTNIVTPVGRNLKVIINGTTYHIPLYN